jgi:hypothetical protein
MFATAHQGDGRDQSGENCADGKGELVVSIKPISALLIFIASVPAAAGSDAANALVRELKIRTYTAKWQDDNIYELREGYIVRTNFCNVRASLEAVVVTDSKIIFIDSDEVCDVADVYRR